jgi:hypothetical protein
MDSSISPSSISPNTRPIFRLRQIIWYLLAILEILLVFRFFLKLLGANPLSAFSSFIYGVTYIFMAPFVNIFKISYPDGNALNWATLLAMFVYWLVAAGALRFLTMSMAISTREADRRLKGDVNNF